MRSSRIIFPTAAMTLLVAGLGLRAEAAHRAAVSRLLPTHAVTARAEFPVKHFALRTPVSQAIAGRHPANIQRIEELQRQADSMKKTLDLAREDVVASAILQGSIGGAAAAGRIQEKEDDYDNVLRQLRMEQSAENANTERITFGIIRGETFTQRPT